MRVLEIDHPLVAHKLTVLRKRETPSMIFRQLTEELLTLLAYEATRNVRVEEIEIQRGMLVNQDPPSHDKLRRIISRGFTPRAVERLRADLDAAALDHVAAVVDAALREVGAR